MAVVQLNRAILESLVGKFGIYFVQILSILILSRVFSPETFGVVASIHVFLMFFHLFSDFGIAPAIISRGAVTPEERDGVFSFTLLLGILVGIIFYCFSFFLKRFSVMKQTKIA